MPRIVVHASHEHLKATRVLVGAASQAKPVKLCIPQHFANINADIGLYQELKYTKHMKYTKYTKHKRYTTYTNIQNKNYGIKYIFKTYYYFVLFKKNPPILIPGVSQSSLPVGKI